MLASFNQGPFQSQEYGNSCDNIGYFVHTLLGKSSYCQSEVDQPKMVDNNPSGPDPRKKILA